MSEINNNPLARATQSNIGELADLLKNYKERLTENVNSGPAAQNSVKLPDAGATTKKITMDTALSINFEQCDNKSKLINKYTVC